MFDSLVAKDCQYPRDPLQPAIKKKLHYANSEQVASQYICVLSMGVLKPKLPDECSGQNLGAFDLTYSDDNEDWTLCNSPTWSLSSSDDSLPQVRAMVDASTPVEIILDPGAGVSALPRSYGTVGIEVGQHEAQFIDAQGSPLHVHSTRFAKVTFGDVTLKERLLVTDVGIPILALGHLVRAGWSLQSNGQERYLMKGHKYFQVGFKRSSLCAVGSINVISNNDAELIDVRKSTSGNVSDAREDGADNGHDEVETSGARFVAFKEAALDKKEIPEEHVSKSTQVVGDLNQELSINAITALYNPCWSI